MSTWRKYWAFTRIAAAEAAAERGDVYGRCLFFVVILAVFAALWQAIGEQGLPLGRDPARLIWYLAGTEWILLMAPTRHLDIQEDVRRGDIAYQLPRPVAYPRAVLAQCLGMLSVRAPLLGVVAFGSAFALTRQVPDVHALLWLVPFGLAASLVLAEIYVGLGLCAFWLSDATPVYWVAGKLLFILGGLMLPLEFYPSWLQTVASLTPFPSLLAGPAGLLLYGSEAATWELAARLFFWGIFLFGAVELLFLRATRNLCVNGG